MVLRQVRGKTVVVTGATSGIGLETARAFLRAGANVVAAGRREERLEAFAAEAGDRSAAVMTMVTDVTKEKEVKALIAAAAERFESVDILVNNAGVGMVARFEEQSLTDFRRLMDVNFWGAVYACRAAVPVMTAQRTGGVIINVSSILGRRGAPFNTAYSASKFALAGFSEALRAELLGANIEVSTVYPGMVETEFFGHASDDPGMAAQVAAIPKLPARELARVIVEDARFPQPEIVMALDAQTIDLMNRLAPWALDWAMAAGAAFGPRPEGR